MKASVWITGTLLLTACSVGSDDAVPSEVHINLIEQRLEKHPCVGDLSKWERNYRFAKTSGFSAYAANADIDVIEFHLRRAGATMIHPVRNIMRRGEIEDWPDGKYIRSIDGRYKLGENRLRVARCSRLEKSP